VPFLGQTAGLFSLKKPSSGKKIALFSHFTDPPEQVCGRSYFFEKPMATKPAKGRFYQNCLRTG
jgi:hypothetical protein